MERQAFQVCEWRIENFSCWNAAVHGHSITSPNPVLENVREMYLYPRHSMGKEVQQMAVAFPISTNAELYSGGNLSFMDSDGSLICTKRTHTAGFKYIPSGLTFEEVAAKVKNRGDRLTIRLCLPSKKDHAVAVSTTLDFSHLSLKIDPKSIQSMKSDDVKNISIIRYSKEYVLDELLLKAMRKNETVEFILELLTKTEDAISVESQWCLQTADKNFVRNEEHKFVFRNCEPWKFTNSSMSELVQKGITIHLNLKIFNGDQILNKLKAPSEITTVPKETVSFFDQGSFKNKDSATSNKTVDSVTALTKDLMCLYQDQDLSDFQLKCHDVTFPVHKLILSARSPVFKTMLSTDMKESASGMVDIGDLDPSTLSLFLTYLYTGAVEEDLQSDRALKLYYAADKYQVSSLKRECADFLRDNVSIDTVCDILSFADQHQDEELSAVSQNFVVNNYSEVLESKEWASFMDSEPRLASKTLTQIGQKKRLA